MKKLLLILLCLPLLFSCGEKESPSEEVAVYTGEENSYFGNSIDLKNRYPIYVFLSEAFNYDKFVKKEEQNYFNIIDNKLFIKNKKDSIIKSDNFDCIKFMSNSICIYINNDDVNIISSFGNHKVLKDIKYKRVNLYRTCELSGGFDVENVYVFYNDKYEICFSSIRYSSSMPKPSSSSYSSELYIYDKSRSQHILDVRNKSKEVGLDGAGGNIEYMFKGIVYFSKIKQEWTNSLSIEENMILNGSNAFSKNLNYATTTSRGVSNALYYRSGNIIKSEEWGNCN